MCRNTSLFALKLGDLFQSELLKSVVYLEFHFTVVQIFFFLEFEIVTA